MNSNAVHDVLAEAFPADEPPSGEGPAAVFARADRISGRRRATGAVAVAAVVVATATVVVGTAGLVPGYGPAGPGGLSAGGPGGGPAAPSAGSTTTAAASATPTSSTDGRSKAPSGSSLDPPDFDVLATLTRLLPRVARSGVPPPRMISPGST